DIDGGLVGGQCRLGGLDATGDLFAGRAQLRLDAIDVRLQSCPFQARRLAVQLGDDVARLQRVALDQIEIINLTIQPAGYSNHIGFDTGVAGADMPDLAANPQAQPDQHQHDD